MVQLNRPFENWTGNRMVKDDLKTGYKLSQENDQLTGQSGF
jgi:hypothetical protein